MRIEVRGPATSELADRRPGMAWLARALGVRQVARQHAARARARRTRPAALGRGLAQRGAEPWPLPGLAPRAGCLEMGRCGRGERALLGRRDPGGAGRRVHQPAPRPLRVARGAHRRALAGSGRGAPGPAILVRESYDPALDPLVDAHRLRHGLDVIHRGKPGASARILRSLKQGRPVGFLPDLGGRVRTELVDWLGGPRELPIGPLRIAQRTGAPLLLGYLEPRSGGGFTLRITRSEALSAASPAQALAQDLERVILKHPEHWLWMGRSS